MKVGFVQRLDRCGLLLAAQTGRGRDTHRFTKEDHKYACKRVECRHCSKSMTSKFVSRHHNRLTAITGTVMSAVLPWQNLPVHTSSVNSVAEFVLASEMLVARLREMSGPTSPILGGWLYTQFNLLPNTARRFQPHVHLWIYIDPAKIDWARSQLKLLSAEHCFAPLLCSKPPTNGNLAGIADYYRSEGMVQFSDDLDSSHQLSLNRWERKKPLGALVLEHVARMSGKPPHVCSLFGIVHARMFRSIEKHQQLKDATDMQRKLYTRSRRTMPVTFDEELFQVAVLKRCPNSNCRSQDNRIMKHGKYKDGRQQYKCKDCGDRFFKAYPIDFAALEKPGQKLPSIKVRRIKKLRAKKLSFREIAKRTGHSLATITKYLDGT